MVAVREWWEEHVSAAGDYIGLDGGVTGDHRRDADTTAALETGGKSAETMGMAKELSFEESVAQLEKIVAAIESGQIGLEDSLTKYEQGMELVKKCRGILDKAEKRIEQLQETPAGLVAEAVDVGQTLNDQ